MKKLSAILVVAFLAGTTMAAIPMAGGVAVENFDSMGVIPNLSTFQYEAPAGWTAIANGVDFSTNLGQNGGSTDPDWVSWGAPSVGAVAAYNQGMEYEADRALAGLLAAMQPAHMPVALGVLYCDPARSYEASVTDEVEAARRSHPASIAELLHSGHTWTVS